MMDEFLRLAKANTARNVETCGVLSGSLVSTTQLSAHWVVILPLETSSVAMVGTMFTRVLWTIDLFLSLHLSEEGHVFCFDPDHTKARSYIWHRKFFCFPLSFRPASLGRTSNDFVGLNSPIRQPWSVCHREPTRSFSLLFLVNISARSFFSILCGMLDAVPNTQRGGDIRLSRQARFIFAWLDTCELVLSAEFSLIGA